MDTQMLRGMLDATRQTRGGRLGEATALLQRLLRQPAPAGPMPPGPPTIDGACEPGPAGRFLSQTHAGPCGSRDFRLYVPGAAGPGRRPLVVMLHGCTQSPEDFAAGTRMNAAAEAHGFLVAYPAQTAAANRSKCWNWFNAGDQARDRGEPGVIAGIVRQVMAAHDVDPRRVFVAGLSAGGAQAAIMAQAYPELFAAVGVHSGLACGAARDMASAFAAMRQGAAGSGGIAIPAIVFHGDRDATVSPRNGDAVAAQARATTSAGPRVSTGRVPGGHAYTVTTHADADGRPVLEQWLVHGAGHAWFGGSAAGSYTDPQGPDATGEMVRFFLRRVPTMK